MASLTIDRSSANDPLLAVRRVPGLMAQLLATLLRLFIVSMELLLSLITIPLTLPFLLLRALTWGCALLDNTLVEGKRGYAPARGIPNLSQEEANEPISLRRAERGRP